MSTRIW